MFARNNRTEFGTRIHGRSIEWCYSVPHSSYSTRCRFFAYCGNDSRSMAILEGSNHGRPCHPFYQSWMVRSWFLLPLYSLPVHHSPFLCLLYSSFTRMVPVLEACSEIPFWHSASSLAICLSVGCSVSLRTTELLELCKLHALILSEIGWIWFSIHMFPCNRCYRFCR